jgi:Rad3-related DNA helicase
MTDDSRNEFLASLSEGRDENSAVTGFAVLGGVFAEGVDLPGRRLDGAIITGVGLPAVTFEQEVIRQYFEENTDHGFLYAYVYPGMNRVIQAAGRVIRSDVDRGVIVLLGKRLVQQPYRGVWEEVFPDAILTTSIGEIADHLREFRRSPTIETDALPNGG